MGKSASKIGILGGTFDPIHNGHIALARAALEQLKLDRVYMVLSPHSPFKTDKDLTPVAQRLEMLTLAIQGMEKIFIGDWELNRRGPSYTVKTLSDYKKANPGHDLYLILGSDALENFHKWKSPEKIMKFASLVIGRRPGMPLKVSNLEGRMFFLRGEFPEVSSTAIRYGVAKGRRPEGVAAAVAKVIKHLRLYER